MNQKKLPVYDSERDEVLKNQIRYTLPARIGNWNDELFLREEQEKLLKYKRDHCQLLTQKVRTVYRNLLKPLEPQREIGCVNYGRLYHIKATEVADSLREPECPRDRTTGLYLAGTFGEGDINRGEHFVHGCTITASPDKRDFVRNLFVFESTDIDRDGTSVNYGDDVYVRISETGAGQLYVQCEQATVETFGTYLRVRLTQTPDTYCRFKILHWNPEYRVQTIGVGVPYRARIIIKHTATGENLAVNTRQWIATFFGPECTVICHTFKDSHKMETAENMFCIVGHRELNKNLIVRASKGEPIPDNMWE